MSYLMWMIPNTILKGQMFEESWEMDYKKSERFAEFFGVTSDELIVSHHRGEVLKRKAVLDIMCKLGISRFFGKILIRWGKFYISDICWYEFKKMHNAKGLVRLCWKSE